MPHLPRPREVRRAFSSGLSSPHPTPGGFREANVAAAAHLHECVVVPVLGPRPARHLFELHKSPAGHIFATHPQIIPHRRGNIETGTLVEIGQRSLRPEHILPVVRAEGPAIFPLRIGLATLVTDDNPTTFAHRLPRLHKRLAEPRNHPRRFGLGFSPGHVVVRKGDVKWILPGNKTRRNVTPAITRVRIVVSTEIVRPADIPGTFAVRHGVVLRWLFSHPKHGRHNVVLPRITPGIPRTSG